MEEEAVAELDWGRGAQGTPAQTEGRPHAALAPAREARRRGVPDEMPENEAAEALIRSGRLSEDESASRARVTRALEHRQTRQCPVFCDASASSTAAGRIGRWRNRPPVAAKMALPMAGATTVVPGSPRPTGCSVLSMNSMSSSGTSPMRSGV